jgi:phosphoribosylglycinamide formyltransferase-1
MSQKNIAILISGKGSNAKNLLMQEQLCKKFIFHILSSKENEYLSTFCESRNTAYQEFSKNADVRNRELSSYLDQNNIDFIVLAGYLKLIPKEIIVRFRGKIINIHPSLLPKFGGHGMYGKHVHKAVFESNQKVSGVTIHYVNEEYDKGEIIKQVSVNIESCENPLEIEKEIQKIEHRLLPDTIMQIW